jgi:hypothetical protein
MVTHRLKRVTAEQMGVLWKNHAIRGELGKPGAAPEAYWVSASGHIEIFPLPAPGTIKSIHIEIEEHGPLSQNPPRR